MLAPMQALAAVFRKQEQRLLNYFYAHSVDQY